MQNDDLIKRYYSQLLLDGMSVEKQKLLSKKSVTVIGCGGLGSPLATYLAGSGIGNIILIDHDVVELRNLHRQVFYCENDIGTNKVDVLAKYLKSLNSNISIQTNAKRSWDLVNKDLKSDLLIDCA
ncbi:MAG: ThiF family adenylyltransferase, partial [SAR86 cluster bacterium]|nr:ThiF family adenylyltransferase [SAR86 cluster bacterium]